MQVQIHSIHFDADKKLIEFIEEKLEKLRLFHAQIISAEVTLKVDKGDNRENKVSEIKLTVPGKDLFAKKQSKSFEESTDQAVDALRKQIEKHKTKMMDH
jgi:putative sigma-54 modulation protein